MANLAENSHGAFRVTAAGELVDVAYFIQRAGGVEYVLLRHAFTEFHPRFRFFAARQMLAVLTPGILQDFCKAEQIRAVRVIFNRVLVPSVVLISVRSVLLRFSFRIWIVGGDERQHDRHAGGRHDHGCGSGTLLRIPSSSEER